MKTKIGFFLLPEEEIKIQIKNIKQNFVKKKVISKYLNHPVHLTVYVFDTNQSNLNSIISEIKNISTFYKMIEVTSLGWTIFTNDKLTGMNTLCLEVRKTEQLEVIQNNLINVFKKFSNKKKITELEDTFNLNQLKFGYPFVGESWRPHITIGSLKMDNKEILSLVSSDSIKKEIILNTLSLFEIKGDEHINIANIKLNI